MGIKILFAVILAMVVLASAQIIDTAGLIPLSAIGNPSNVSTVTRVYAVTRTNTAIGASPTPDRTKENVHCFNCGFKGTRQQIRRAIAFFCMGGIDGNFGGQLASDKILRDGETLGLAYLPTDKLLVRVIVRMNDGCVLDFNNWDQETCNSRFNRPLDECDTDGTYTKRGGFMLDNCSRWTVDPQDYGTNTDKCSKESVNAIPPEGCAGWTQDTYFFGDDTCEGRTAGFM